MNTSYRFIFAVLGLVVVAAFILNNNIADFQTIDISSFDFSKVFGLLGSIAFISLLVERASEIFMVDTEKEQKESIRREVTVMETRRDVLSPEETEEKTQKVAQLNTMQEDRRKKVSFFAFALGLIIALFGVRILTNLISEPETMTAVQSKFINIIDMVLTGCVIAGGSEGIHYIIKTFSNFLPGEFPRRGL